MRSNRKMLLFLRLAVIVTVLAVGVVAFTGLFKSQEGINPDLKVTQPVDDFTKMVFTSPKGEYLGEKQVAAFTSVGDIMFHGTQITNAYDSGSGSYNFDDNFKNVNKFFEAADIAMGNFETVTAGGTPQGYPVFNAPDEVLDSIKSSGFDVLTTANNHSLDKGKTGVLRTLEEIEKRDLISTGTFSEPEDEITVLETKGIRVGLIAYTYGLNGMESLLTPAELGYMINIIDEEKIKQDIQKAKDQDCDMIFVSIHWGNEYQLSPTNQQEQLANKIFNWGADVVLGSHPHVIQRSEIINIGGEDKFVIYSQGNFLSNQRRETLPSISARNYTEDGVIVHIKVEKDMITGKASLASVSYTPTWVYRYNAGGRLKYEILPVKESIETMSLGSQVLEKLKQSYDNTTGKMSYYNRAIQ
ncbi:MAG TPA: capsular biosynthesis protein [Eubacteriaceae bacterium]|jgi:poly-gamma-glutamate synthesis protein (capsule biosynthesis protein)|nr:capsular biosynthesis protein [Eubacteriaceae bacterium]